MLEIMGYLLCIYLILKGIEIYQQDTIIEKLSNKERALGVVILIITIILAVVFGVLIYFQARHVTDIMKRPWY